MFTMRQIGVPNELQLLLPSVLLIMGVVFVIWAIAGIIMLKTGIHKKKIERLLSESQERLKDSNYVSRLRSLGLKLDDEYGGYGF